MKKTFLLLALSLLAIGCNNDFENCENAPQLSPPIEKSVNAIYKIRRQDNSDQVYTVGADRIYSLDRKGQTFLRVQIFYKTDYENVYSSLKRQGLKDGYDFRIAEKYPPLWGYYEIEFNWFFIQV